MICLISFHVKEMTKTLQGLVKNSTFESLIGSATYDFTDNIVIPKSGAMNYYHGFFHQPLGDEVIGDHQDKHEEVLAGLQAVAQAFKAREERKRGEASRMYAANLPQHNTMQEHAAPEPAPVGPLGAGESEHFRDRLERRQQQAKATPIVFNHQAREDARRKAERSREMGQRREDGKYDNIPRYDIGTPRGEPEAAPNPQLQAKYDRRLLSSRKVPATSRSSTAAESSSRANATRRGVGDANAQMRRESHQQSANKRARPQEPPTRLRKRKVEVPPTARQRVDIGPLGTAPR
jgi:hypothetical protein